MAPFLVHWSQSEKLYEIKPPSYKDKSEGLQLKAKLEVHISLSRKPNFYEIDTYFATYQIILFKSRFWRESFLQPIHWIFSVDHSSRASARCNRCTAQRCVLNQISSGTNLDFFFISPTKITSFFISKVSFQSWKLVEWFWE